MKLAKLHLSAQKRALLSAIGSALLIVCQFIPDDKESYAKGWGLLGLLLSLAAVFLFLIPITVMFARPADQDELYQRNFAAASSWTVNVILIGLIATEMFLDFRSIKTLTFNTDLLTVLFGLVICLQNILLAVFESRGAVKGDDEEDA